MIRKYASPLRGHVRVVFELPAGIWADRVFVCGDFNGWGETPNPMALDRNGVWQAIVDLPEGTSHEYRYLIDGEWHTDYHADGHTTNVHGTENSIVHAVLSMSPAPAAKSAVAALDHAAAAKARTDLIRKWQARRRKLETAA